MKKLAKTKRLFVILAVIVLAVSVFTLTGCLGCSSSVYKRAGTYEVGTDIDAGEYILYPNSGSASYGYIAVTKTKDAKSGSADFLLSESFTGRQYVVLEEGQFIKITTANLYSVAEAPALSKNADGSYIPGQYKIGSDIDAGEYIVEESGDGDVYLDVKLSPNAKSGMSDEFLFNDSFTYRHYIMAESGQYISFKQGGLYKAADAPAIVKNTYGTYKAGQYKVGKDITAGSYTIAPNAAVGTASYLITSLPLCSFTSEHYIKYGSVTESETVTLEDGQYIQIQRGYFTAAL